VSVAIVFVAVVLLGAIVVVAMGRGGELSREAGDEPAAADFASWADVAGYRPPAALLGYHAGATERALQLISRSIAERDAEIAWLRGRLRDLQPEGARDHGQLLDPAGPAGSTGPIAARVGQGTTAQVGQGTTAQVGQGTTAQVGQGTTAQVGQGTTAQVGQGTAARSADDA
jgi:hypothetical protein